MKVAIIGSRSLLDLNIKNHIPKKATLIITGGARGIDQLAENYADEKQIPKLVIKPEYKKYGRAAPLIRNKKIIENSNIVVIFWDGKSKGTQYAIKYAFSLGKQIVIHRVLKI